MRICVSQSNQLLLIAEPKQLQIYQTDRTSNLGKSGLIIEPMKLILNRHDEETIPGVRLSNDSNDARRRS